jgi:hypothetical protein
MESRAQFAEVLERVIGGPPLDWQREVDDERDAKAGKR